MADLPVSRSAAPSLTQAPPTEFVEFPDDLGPVGDDVVITKRH
ncbi:hypothetical protein [Streptomyces luteolifulvus]|nr:hypothetical protein [Streptomyces luteolifulvus]